MLVIFMEEIKIYKLGAVQCPESRPTVMKIAQILHILGGEMHVRFFFLFVSVHELIVITLSISSL